ncbi:hypothetical protein [Streptomyces sp. NPDC048521]
MTSTSGAVAGRPPKGRGELRDQPPRVRGRWAGPCATASAVGYSRP